MKIYIVREMNIHDEAKILAVCATEILAEEWIAKYTRPRNRYAQAIVEDWDVLTEPTLTEAGAEHVAKTLRWKIR